jgi:hypothetical protein
VGEGNIKWTEETALCFVTKTDFVKNSCKIQCHDHTPSSAVGMLDSVNVLIESNVYKIPLLGKDPRIIAKRYSRSL